MCFYFINNYYYTQVKFAIKTKYLFICSNNTLFLIIDHITILRYKLLFYKPYFFIQKLLFCANNTIIIFAAIMHCYKL